MARLQKTLTDYLVIAISPALIMTLVGSLVYFLIAVFYQGSHQGRMEYIFALFVFAAVLIARISIDEGREHAMMYAIALALAMLLVLGRFTSSPTLFNIIILSVILWCADKLTWDCTVIDEREDASGEGLLQTVGLEGSKEPPTTSPSAGIRDLEATTSRDQPAAPKTWWQRFVEHRKRPHAPGVWVIYFSLAALPLFGIGQRFVPAADVEARRYVFKLLCVYTASGLGLLMTTSFLGLRRYLRQRRLEMPMEMAGVWLTVGSVLIVTLMFACWLLPRPSPEYSVTQVPFQIRSPSNLEASRYGWGKEGAKDKRHAAPATAPAQQDQQGRPGGQGSQGRTEQGQAKGQQGSGGTSPGGQQGAGKQPGGQQSGGQSAGGAKSGTQPSGSQGGGKQNSGGQQGAGKQSGGQQSGGKASGEGKSGQQPSASEGGGKQISAGQNAGQEQSKRPQEGSKQGQSQAGQQGSSPQSGPQDGQSDPSRQNQAAAQGSQSASRPPPSSGNAAESQSAENQKRSEPPSAGTPPEPNSKDNPFESNESNVSPSEAPSDSSSWLPNPSNMLNSVLGLIPFGLKWLYNLIFIAIAGYLIWRNRERVLEALRNFWDAIRNFWDRLFGVRPAKPAGEEAAVVAAVPPRPFADFPDPFATGDAQRWSPRDLVAYSFQALEAWGREHGCQRGQEQTPHEFAGALTACEATVGREAGHLADLYCCAAYSSGLLPRDRVGRLQELWQVMRARKAAGPQPT